MSSFDLMAAVQPDEGTFVIVGIVPGQMPEQRFAETRADADKIVARMARQHKNVFFGVAKYAEYNDEPGRTKNHVRALKTLWVDLDCGAAKAAATNKNGTPKGYATQKDALAALSTFGATLGLPRPAVVNSGSGIHAYWPLEEAIDRDTWEPLAAGLKAKCVEHGVWADPAVFEAARILRVPGTTNYKSDPPAPVTVICPPSRALSLAEAQSRFATDTPVGSIFALAGATSTMASRNKRTALGAAMEEGEREYAPKSFHRILQRCAQIQDCVANSDSLDEPSWFAALSIATHCADRDKAIAKVSAGHPDYDFATAESKTHHIAGPRTCAQFDSIRPGICDSCPHLTKIKSPISLGVAAIEAAEEEVEALEQATGHKRPPLPHGYLRQKDGSIWKRSSDPETNDLLVSDKDFYAIKRLEDPIEGGVVLFRLHTHLDGVKEFTISAEKISEISEVRKVLARNGLVCNAKQYIVLGEYVVGSVNALERAAKAETMRLQFGWADNDSKFVIGDKEITVDGTFYSPPSSATSDIAAHMYAKGSMAKWREVFNMYGQKGHERHAFAALSAFGAPLLKFTGQRGAILNVIHSSSGTGKTTILHMCMSVYGKPDDLCTVQKDTENARIHKLGTYNNLPYCVDEITNMSGMAFSDLAYAMSNGKGKDRMEGSGNRLRHNSTKWQTISLCSSNASFYEKLGQAKRSPDGEMMRLFEYKIDYTPNFDMADAKEKFDHQLMQNFGHAGPIYAEWLVHNKEQAVRLLHNMQQKIDRELGLTQRERFWSACIAANLVGGIICTRHLKLFDWNMAAIYKEVGRIVANLGKQVQAPAADSLAVLGEFLSSNVGNTLTVNGTVDRRGGGFTPMPLLLPKGDLIVRYEPDTKQLYVRAALFKKHCVDSQTNYNDTLDDLRTRGIYLGHKSIRMAKGAPLPDGSIYVLQFDMSVSECMDLSHLEQGDAD